MVGLRHQRHFLYRHGYLRFKLLYLYEDVYKRQPDVSREGVQRDILPIVEGSTVNTKYGAVRTDFMPVSYTHLCCSSRPSTGSIG